MALLQNIENALGDTQSPTRHQPSEMSNSDISKKTIRVRVVTRRTEAQRLSDDAQNFLAKKTEDAR
eukprot:5397943-Prymnesium_polylepis.1